MYVKILACVKVKGYESDVFRIDSGVRQVCIMPLWFFSAYMEVVMKEVKTEMGMRGLRFQEERREWILPGFLYVNDWFCLVSRRKT